MTNKLRSSLAIIMFATIACIGAFDFDSASAATISMTTSGAQSIDVMPDSSSNVGTNIGVDNINVVTDCRAGYNLSMSASVSDNNLYLNGNSSNNQSGTYFSPANGTSTLANSPNTWGYLLSDTTPTSSSVFSAVPTSSNPAVLKTPATTASATDIDDSFNVYFGVAMNNSLAPGTYKMIPDTNNSNADGSITYYLTMDASCETYKISYNANSGSGTIANQEVQKGGSIALADNAFTRTNYFFKGWATSSGGSVAYRPSQTITPTGDMTLYAVWGNSTTTTLYNAVTSLTRGNQTNDTNATTGIQTNPTKATSGVYTYDASVFGTSSDSANTSAIYYYRGILDATTGTYGSDGDSMDYPNYVRLGDTCWRIVRTTGSGGVKMIYNGMYGNTTSGSCANAQAAAAIRATSATTATSTATFTSAFAGTSTAQSRSIVGVGYTRNNTYASTSATTATAYSTLFGTNSSYSDNSTNSTIKGNIETWFTNNLNSYASKLEASAGYCNDRTLYPDGSYATSNLISDSTTIVPYGTSSMTVYRFGAYARNANSAQSPTLTCPRATVDLYTTSSASNGNKQLSKPVALLTADEMSFAGSGYGTLQGSGYNSNSYLRSGSNFWLLSPYYRYSSGNAGGFFLGSVGSLDANYVSTAFGVRPAISLKSGTTIESGSGTATDPWVIEEPKTMQSVTSSDLATLMPNTGDTTTLPDARDGQEYTIAKLADGKYWMTTNLNLAGGTTLNASDSNVPSDNYYTLPASTTISSGTAVQSGQFSSDTTAFVFNTGNNTTTCNSSTPCNSYYSWLAATAGGKDSSGNAVSTDGYNAAYSICPKGWRLPTSTTSNASPQTSPNWKTGDWYTLATAYGANLESDFSQSTVTFYKNAGPGTTPNFLLAGYYSDGSFGNGGSNGRYWSSTARSSTGAYFLNFSSGRVRPANNGGRRGGSSVRCVYGS